MIIVIGLGNPGEQYANTRHNVGFMALDAIAERFQFPLFTEQTKFRSQITEGVVENQKIILAKPQTYMNRSGKAIRSLSQFYKISPSDMIVIHDDIDIQLGKIKISVSSGSAGHKGVNSIISELGSPAFARLRIGILPKEGKPPHVEDFVLQHFLQEERSILVETIQHVSEAFKTIVREGIEQAMNQYN